MTFPIQLILINRSILEINCVIGQALQNFIFSSFSARDILFMTFPCALFEICSTKLPFTMGVNNLRSIWATQLSFGILVQRSIIIVDGIV